MPNLYQVAEQYRQFYNYMDEVLSSDEDFTEEDLQLYFETLESIEDNLEQKLENTIKFLRNIEGDIEAFKKEKQRLERKQRYLQNTYDRLKQWMKDSLELNGIDKMNAGNFKVRLQKNNPSVEVYDVEKVPKQYVTKTEIHVDKKLLLTELKEGKQIDGVQLAPEGKHIRIS
ncbi:siphovirus Gp157 family protein [Paenibacillus naphthalenovorans]|uniref:Siphovirus Gp157 n=1 Tax=Paenibacillus naphthalenovorans TaxID=162209 RepID=A0A0U2W3U2_9BACL|nr:siphovirus Gp157 family protein [Paenibacillus naphthalenovorans]ALS22149.1 siphovirus Gp157 [Paenibacillus naphthalenovorans]